jgi:DNA-binding XRE family transcriptional regulator
MSSTPLVGPKIRDRRRALGVTQSGLSATLGISPSYLNLIEAGKRNIGGTLLKRIAGALGLSVDELDGGCWATSVSWPLSRCSPSCASTPPRRRSSPAAIPAGRAPWWRCTAPGSTAAAP